MEFERNIPLKNFTTFKIGGPAGYFFCAKNEKEIIKAIEWAKEKNIPFFILAGGSNLLVSDKGFNGLVIKIQNSKIKVQNYNAKLKIICEAGVLLAKLIAESSKIKAGGLEWAAGIPGSVGGAIYGNAGAFGGSVGDLVKAVRVYDLEDKKIKVFKNEDCRFFYRESVFKKKKNLIILSAVLVLGKKAKEEIRKKIKEYLTYRRDRQPSGFSAGSVFKNIKLKNIGKKFFEKFPEAKTVVKENNLPAAYLISHANLAGKKKGGAFISLKHPNFILNSKSAKAKDVLFLIRLIKKTVKNKFGLDLEEEIQYLACLPARQGF